MQVEPDDIAEQNDTFESFTKYENLHETVSMTQQVRHSVDIL